MTPQRKKKTYAVVNEFLRNLKRARGSSLHRACSVYNLSDPQQVAEVKKSKV